MHTYANKAYLELLHGPLNLLKLMKIYFSRSFGYVCSKTNASSRKGSPPAGSFLGRGPDCSGLRPFGLASPPCASLALLRSAHGLLVPRPPIEPRRVG